MGIFRRNRSEHEDPWAGHEREEWSDSWLEEAREHGVKPRRDAPAPTASTPPSPTSSGDTARPVGVRPFGRDMLVDHLERCAPEYDDNDDGDLHLGFKIFESDDHVLNVWLTAEGANEDILVVRAVANLAVPKTLWPHVMSVCNAWNKDKRFPKAFLQVPEDVDALWGTIHLEGQFPLSAGCTQPMVDEMVSTTISTAFAFWQEVAEQRLLDDPSIDSRND